ncbi:hypothetical protein FHG87_019839 [Trinorchestia longiramus]|nr:hypothetical protein FHG87_019839 [Trinorchestia longiramus]
MLHIFFHQKYERERVKLDLAIPCNRGGSHIICPPEEARGPPLVDLDKLLLHEEAQLSTTCPAMDDSFSSFHRDDPPPPPEDDPDDPPVQGPMPYEPDDAPWKRRTRESGIRKFFIRMKKLSDVLLPSEEVVLGTPSTVLHTTPLSSTVQRPPYQYHSTPASTLSTPLNSMNVSSPPSLRSLPSQLPSKRPTVSLGHRFTVDSSLSPRNDSGYGSSMGLPLKNANKKAIKLPSVSSSFTFEKFRLRFGLPPAGESIFKNRSNESMSKTFTSNATAQLSDESASRPSNFGILAFQESPVVNSLRSQSYTSKPSTPGDQVAYGNGTTKPTTVSSFSGASACGEEVSVAQGDGNVVARAHGNRNIIPESSADENIVSGASTAGDIVSGASTTGDIVSGASTAGNIVSGASEKLTSLEPSTIPKKLSSPMKDSTTIRSLVGGDKLARKLSSEITED